MLPRLCLFGHWLGKIINTSIPVYISSKHVRGLCFALCQYFEHGTTQQDKTQGDNSELSFNGVYPQPGIERGDLLCEL